VEERHKRAEEHLVVEQTIDPLQLHRQPPDLVRENRLPQADLLSVSSQHPTTPSRAARSLDLFSHEQVPNQRT